MKYLKKYKLFESIRDYIDDIFLDKDEFNVVYQTQDYQIVVYITKKVPSDNNYYKISEIADELSHFISKMKMENHLLKSIKYRDSEWCILWQRGLIWEFNVDALINVNTNIDSLELVFTL